MEVLTAKIRALLRRSYDFGADVSCLSCGGATLRLGDGVLLWQGRTLELTKNEAQILQQLRELGILVRFSRHEIELSELDQLEKLLEEQEEAEWG